MNCATRYISLAGLVLSVLLAGCTGTFSNPRTVQTTNKDPAWHKQFLKTRVTVLQREGDDIKLTGNVFDSTEPQTKVLPVGHTITFPDHHGSKSYTIASISDRGVVFQYKSSFDHRSFGKNLIETDEGGFLLEWTAQVAWKVTSAEDAAVKKSLAYLAETHIDTSGHDLSKPQSIQRVYVSGQRGWVVAWGLKNSSGQDGGLRRVIAGGQLIVRVRDSGKIDLGYGE